MLRRIITTHDPKSGRAVFSDAISEQVSFTGFPVPPGKPPATNYALAYNTNVFPVQGLSPPSSKTPESKANLDIKHYQSQLSQPMPLNPPNGTSCTIIERLQPGFDRAIIHDAAQVGPLQFNLTKLVSSPLLQSVYSEVLRMRIALMLKRTPTQSDVRLGPWQLDKGRFIVLSTQVVAHDEAVWGPDRTQNGKYPWRLWTGQQDGCPLPTKCSMASVPCRPGPIRSAFGGDRAVDLSIHDDEIVVGRNKVDALNSLPRL
ncbi:hypothetical protein Asppvi_001687 [Aspergillus pseudoviridinutans]|uniref:Uncharacterized protein n=1 Tax=Aspergillus pseudoviridinutans TaxID=1517512 RepID=A0A9P3ERM8_9EURO|nr:uncharacterized protein Asppvi_001687 [Aspergillus pseudoviridinutans]GIJ83168.1 hypothetical protein Asppvi_001687 [Aspergillus pseudoviridinutans]